MSRKISDLALSGELAGADVVPVVQGGVTKRASVSQFVDAGRATFVPFWAAAEAVTAGTVRMAPDGDTIARIADGTTRASYDATERAAWTVADHPPAATETTLGLVELATATEARTGDPNRVLTPAAARVTFVPFWTAAETVTVGTIRMSPNGETISSNSTRTAGAAWDATEQAHWTVISPDGNGTTDPEVVRDTMAAALVAGANVTITHDDVADTITVAATDTNTTDPEVVRDTMATALVAGANVTITPNDLADTITIAATDTTDPEVVRDTIAAALVAGANVTITADDVANTITVAATDTNSTDPEVVRDTMATALVAGANVTLTVDDVANTITVAAAGGSTDPEIVRDTMGAALVAGPLTSITVNDVADTITIGATDDLGFVTTFYPGASPGGQAWVASNAARYRRVLNAGTISKIRLHVTASSGNISVAVHLGTGAGLDRVPGTQAATSGAIPCPAVGWHDVLLGASVTVAPGDFLALSCDNVTAQFSGFSGQDNSGLSAGQSYGASTAHPLPAIVPALTPTGFRVPALIGVP